MTKTTCQVCGRAIKANTGTVAHHGYKRPGHGWQTRSCMGAKHVPYEVGHDALDRWIGFLQTAIPATEAKLADHMANPPAELTITRYDAYGRQRPGYPKLVTRPENYDPATAYSSMPDTYANKHSNIRSAYLKDLREMRETLVYATERRNAWVAPHSGEEK